MHPQIESLADRLETQEAGNDIGQFRRVLLGTLHTYLWYIFSRQDFCHATEVSKLQSTAKTQNNHEMFCHGHSTSVMWPKHKTTMKCFVTDNNILTVCISIKESIWSVRSYWSKVQCSLQNHLTRQSKRDLDLPAFNSNSLTHIKINYKHYHYSCTKRLTTLF